MQLKISWRRAPSIFTDPPIPLATEQRRRGLESARQAARAAQQSLTLTKKKQYRRYRRGAGNAYLDWPRWKAAYLREYNRRITLHPAQAHHYIGSSMGGP
ncbi:hypothetical protein F3087_40830 [Nocardia colli]|uniref:Uncharacterized protein n=1 Tax=Nocardia colli TaxID=2545717 RepID=A0A5N0DUM4_9NOCA|nr:hypothetical protein [Nocardia colli]KAA8880463.1 hypothetical protein F3087_40830 [Nocardia colli]